MLSLTSPRHISTLPTAAVRYVIEFDADALRDPARGERDRQRSRTKQRHDPECARAERAVSGPDTSVMMAVIVPTATPP
jgi:hypothetical protein